MGLGRGNPWPGRGQGGQGGQAVHLFTPPLQTIAFLDLRPLRAAPPRAPLGPYMSKNYVDARGVGVLVGNALMDGHSPPVTDARCQ